MGVLVALHCVAIIGVRLWSLLSRLKPSRFIHMLPAQIRVYNTWLAFH